MFSWVTFFATVTARRCAASRPMARPPARVGHHGERAGAPGANATASGSKSCASGATTPGHGSCAAPRDAVGLLLQHAEALQVVARSSLS